MYISKRPFRRTSINVMIVLICLVVFSISFSTTFSFPLSTPSSHTSLHTDEVILMKRQAHGGGGHDHHSGAGHHGAHHGTPDATPSSDPKPSSASTHGHGHAGHNHGSNDVPMRMYFHSDVHDLLLFEAFITTTSETYAAAVIGVFLLACVYALFLYQLKPYLYARFLQGYSDKVPGCTMRMELRRFGYALLHAFEMSFSLLLMLVVMTFNLGWCAAVIAGVLLGTYLFRRGANYNSNAMECTVLPKDPRETSGLCC